MREIYLLLIASIFISSCATHETQYLISIPSQVKRVKKRAISIGIKRIEIPQYLEHSSIALSDFENELRYFSNASWAEAVDVALSKRVVSYLQHKYNDPSIYLYPWGTDMVPKKVVSIRINRFIQRADHVELEVAWEIKTRGTQKPKRGIFSATMPSKSNSAKDVVKAMDATFAKFERYLSDQL